MKRYTEKSILKLFAIVIFGISATILSFVASADPLKPLPGEFTVVMQGADPQTGELIFEGYRTGELSGHLAIRAGITRQTGVALQLSAHWTLTTSWGDTMDGENTLVLNTKSLQLHEHGIIVDATGSLEERIGNFVVIRGQISDLNFYPGVTTVTGHVTVVPAQATQ